MPSTPLGTTFAYATVSSVNEFVAAARADPTGGEFAVVVDALVRSMTGVYPWATHHPAADTIKSVTDFFEGDRRSVVAWLKSAAHEPYITLCLLEYLRDQFAWMPAAVPQTRHADRGLVKALAAAGTASDFVREACLQETGEEWVRIPWWSVASFNATLSGVLCLIPPVVPLDEADSAKTVQAISALGIVSGGSAPNLWSRMSMAHSEGDRADYARRVMRRVHRLPTRDVDELDVMATYHARRIFLEPLPVHVASAQATALAARLGRSYVPATDPAWHACICVHCCALLSRVITHDTETWNFRLASLCFRVVRRLCGACSGLSVGRGAVDPCHGCGGVGYELICGRKISAKRVAGRARLSEDAVDNGDEAITRGVFAVTKNERPCLAPLLRVSMFGVVLNFNNERYAMCPRLGCASIFRVTAAAATPGNNIMCPACTSDAVRIHASLASFPLERCVVCNYMCRSMRRFWVAPRPGSRRLVAVFVCANHYSSEMEKLSDGATIEDVVRVSSVPLRGGTSAVAGGAKRPPKRIMVGDRHVVSAKGVVARDPLGMPPFVTGLKASHVYPCTGKNVRMTPSEIWCTLQVEGVPHEMSPFHPRVAGVKRSAGAMLGISA